MQSAEQRAALASELERHVAEEGAVLESYHSLSDRLEEGRLGILINHIVTDEEMHHFLFRTLAEWLRAPEAPGGIRAATGPHREEILRQTRMLRSHERQTIDACRGLKSRLSGDEGELFDAILDAIGLDSEKHDRLLGAVERLLAR
jgi:hypothetical protein